MELWKEANGLAVMVRLVCLFVCLSVGASCKGVVCFPAEAGVGHSCLAEQVVGAAVVCVWLGVCVCFETLLFLPCGDGVGVFVKSGSILGIHSDQTRFV